MEVRVGEPQPNDPCGPRRRYRQCRTRSGGVPFLAGAAAASGARRRDYRRRSESPSASHPRGPAVDVRDGRRPAARAQALNQRSMPLSGRAGFPTTVIPGCTSSTTTAPIPTVEPAPTVTRPRTAAPIPTYAVAPFVAPPPISAPDPTFARSPRTTSGSRTARVLTMAWRPTCAHRVHRSLRQAPCPVPERRARRDPGRGVHEGRPPGRQRSDPPPGPGVQHQRHRRRSRRSTAATWAPSSRRRKERLVIAQVRHIEERGHARRRIASTMPRSRQTSGVFAPPR